jgi:uncharacterized membrane protein YphA (DoxX/SURF4 family)
MNDTELQTLRVIKLACRISLGLVWLYEGLVPKILCLQAHLEQIDLVQRSHLFWPTPTITLRTLGIAQAIAGIILIIGWRERAAAFAATSGMVVLIILVAAGQPSMLTDPFGALVKDLCLASCALTVWLLSPILSSSR